MQSGKLKINYITPHGYITDSISTTRLQNNLMGTFESINRVDSATCIISTLDGFSLYRITTDSLSSLSNSYKFLIKKVIISSSNEEIDSYFYNGFPTDRQHQTILRKYRPDASYVNSEATGFRFPEQTTTFMCPQSDAMIGWKRTKPSYEEEYKADAPMDVRSQYGHGYTFPCLFRVGDNGWVLVSETGVDSRYCGSRLSDVTEGNLYTVAFPMAEENNGNGTVAPAFALPGSTPWRTITVGETLKPIVETTVIWDVVEPLYETEHNYQMGRGTWSWILWQDGSINYDDQVRYVDLAAAMGYEYVLIDNWWDTKIGHKRNTS